MGQIERLGADCGQVWLLCQIQYWVRRLGVAELVQAQAHPVGVDTADAERLLNRRFDKTGIMLAVELQNPHEFLHTTTFRPLLAQSQQQPFVAQRPGALPHANGLGMVEGTGALGKQWQVVQRVKHVLLTRMITACLDAGLPCFPDPPAFTRYAIYSFIALFQVIALFSLSIRVENKRRRRGYSPEWR